MIYGSIIGVFERIRGGAGEVILGWFGDIIKRGNLPGS
jgi:hypothetical protein